MPVCDRSINLRNALSSLGSHTMKMVHFIFCSIPSGTSNSNSPAVWTMVGSYNYVLYTNDTAFLSQNWAGYLKAMDFIYGKVGERDLLNVTGLRDWARWQTGFNGSEPNMMYTMFAP
jgi:hypothetical protein